MSSRGLQIAPGVVRSTQLLTLDRPKFADVRRLASELPDGTLTGNASYTGAPWNRSSPSRKSSWIQVLGHGFPHEHRAPPHVESAGGNLRANVGSFEREGNLGDVCRFAVRNPLPRLLLMARSHASRARMRLHIAWANRNARVSSRAPTATSWSIASSMAVRTTWSA